VETDFAKPSPILCNLEDLLKCKIHSTNVAIFSSCAFKILMERKEKKAKKTLKKGKSPHGGLERRLVKNCFQERKHKVKQFIVIKQDSIIFLLYHSS